VVANIGDVSGVTLALESGAEGVGLLPTEFLYLKRSKMPDEEEQYQAYREILTAFGGRPVVLPWTLAETKICPTSTRPVR
jgi:phosphotransferase system enzyme I (PtsI)